METCQKSRISQYWNVHDLPYSVIPGRSSAVKHRTRECASEAAMFCSALFPTLYTEVERILKIFHDTRVLREVVEPFCQHGFNVVLLNSRGVGGSTGWASFTGLPEAEDLKEVIKWLMENQFPALKELVLLVRLLDLYSRRSLHYFPYRDTHTVAYRYRISDPCQRLSKPDTSSFPIL